MTFLLHLLAVIGMALPHLLGYNLVFGRGKIFHFGPLGLSLVCSYTLFLILLTTHSYPIAIAAGFAATLLCYLLISLLALRLEPDALGLLTIALHLGLYAVVLNWTSMTHGALGIPRIPRLPFLTSPLHFAILACGISALWGYLLWRIDRGRLGRQLHALAEHPWHAQAMGVSRRQTYLIAFAILTVGCTITNILYPQYLFLLHPSEFTFTHFIFMIMVIVAGNPGSVPGTILSTILLVLLREGLRFLPLPTGMIGPLRLILFGIILLAAVWIRRDTLFPKPRSI